jgi:hypothetical protein
VLEPENSYNTDFDSPSYYNTLDNQFEIVDVGNTLTNVYPWKSWSDNYSYSVSSISINNPGMGYTQVPTLIISKPDLSNGVTATAVAYVASNKVSLVRIINSGTGYTKTPTVSISGGGLVTTTATFYAQLGNNNIRKNAVTIKFDRISTVDQIGDIQVTDQFVCNGSQNEFVLNWLTQPDKQKINITLDSNLVLISDYTVVYYTKLFNGYNKQYSKIVFLNYIPKFDQILTVIYEKNVELMTGIERLSHFTKLTDFSTVTSGLVYPQTTLKGVPFGHTSAWSEPYPNYDTFTWDDDVSNYTTAIVTANSNDTGFSPRGPLPGGTSVKVQSTKGISLYQYANVISHSVPRFNTSTLMVMDVSTDTVWLNAQVLPGDDLVPGDVIEFWNNDSNFSVLDSIVQGGSWSTSTNSSIMNIIGIDPNDVSHDTTTGLYYLGGIDTSNVIVDGDGYYTENTGYTPEELISGTATDSLGINVYTKDLIGAPTIYSSSVPILPGIRTIIPLKLLPPNADSITVNFNNILFTYDPNTDTSEPNNFSIDWINSNLIIPSQSVGGLLGYTIITIGGNEYIDTEYLTVKGYTSLQISSLAAVTTVKSVYVSLNGIGLSTATSIISPYYSFGPVSQDNRRASVKIYNLTTTTLYEAQAWFFASPYKHFNEIREQSFIISSVSTPNNLTLSQSPGTLGPPEANIVVEVVNSKGTSILQSPDIKYYEISDPAQTFPVPTQYIYTTVSSTTNAGESTIPISSTANIRLYSLITNQSNISSVATNTNVVAIGVDTITLSAPTLKTFNSGDILKFQLNTDQNFKVYRNGLELDFGFDYYFEVDNQLLGFIPGSVYTGDVIAIVSHVGGPLYDYYVDGDQLIIVANTPNITEFPSTIRAITYTNQDSMLIRKDTLDGNASGRYCMSRAVTNDNYVWVSVDGTSLINKVDFVVLEDQVTVQLSQQFADVSVQRVTITSLSSSPLATNVLGYRISIDMFNNTQFKRLSAQNTTYLTQPLRFNDTEIYVADAGVLSQPLVSKKIPGVVIIAGERIEFFRMTNNTLSQLRRSTLGTSPNFYSGINTKVIDQGIGQTIPYAEKIYKQSYLNLGTNNVYVISKTPQSIYYEKAMIAVSNTTTAVLQSKTYYNNLDYVQVNVNGQPIDQTTSTYTVISNLGGGN